MQKFNPGKKRKVTPEKAQQLLKKQEIIVNTEEAELVLDFMYMLAEISVRQYLNPVPPAVTKKDSSYD